MHKMCGSFMDSDWTANPADLQKRGSTWMKIGSAHGMAYNGYISDVALYNTSNLAGPVTVRLFEEFSDIMADDLSVRPPGVPCDDDVSYRWPAESHKSTLVGYWRMSDGARNFDAAPGIGGNWYEEYFFVNSSKTIDWSNVKFLQYPYQVKQDVATATGRGLWDYQRGIARYHEELELNGYEAADQLSLMNITTPLMSIRTAMVEMNVTSTNHTVREASGNPMLITTVAGAANGGAPLGKLTYDYTATPISNSMPRVFVPNVLLSMTPDECTLTYGTHDRMYAPSQFTTCSFGGVKEPGATVRDPLDLKPYASALYCCYSQPHKVQKPALETSNSHGYRVSKMHLPIHFTEMGILGNVDFTPSLGSVQSRAMRVKTYGSTNLDFGPRDSRQAEFGSHLNRPVYEGDTRPFMVGLSFL